MTAPAKISSVEVVNLFSWPSARVELHPGLNVIVGPSDSGKSNLWRAIAAVAENAPAGRILRVGSASGSAAIEFDDKSWVSLHKTAKGGNEYRTGSGPSVSQEYRAVGSGVPPQVSSSLGLGEVDLSGIPVNLHLAPQRGPAFGIDSKPSDLARVVGAVSGLDVVYAALSAAESDRKRSEAEAKTTADAFRSAKASFDATVERMSRADASAEIAEARKISDDHDAAVRAAEHADILADRLERSARVARERAEVVAGSVGIRDEITRAVSAWTEATRAANAADELAERIETEAGSLGEAVDLVAESLSSLESANEVVRRLVAKKCPICGRKP